MDFELSDEQKLIREAAREFADQLQAKFVELLAATGEGRLRAAWATLSNRYNHC